MKGEKTDLRIKRLEKQVSQLCDLVLNMKTSLDKVLQERVAGQLIRKPHRKPGTESMSELIEIRDRKLPNPWAINAALNLLDSRVVRQLIKNSYETYEPTIKALQQTNEWMSAEDVGKITGRKRNTETTYLRRLYEAGLVKRKKQGRKVVYKLGDIRSVQRIFEISP